MSEHNKTVQQLVEGFQHTLDTANPDFLPAIPELVDDLRHDGKFNRVQPGLAPGLYLDPAITVPGNLKGFAFQHQPGSRIGREDSHNKVFFGRLWAIPEEGAERQARIAVKPIPAERKDGMLGELALFQYMGRLALPTFTPAGVHISENGTNHLLTYFNGPVATMDTVDWANLPQEEIWNELRFAVDSLALLHSNMLFHGDLYFRNIGFNERGETVIVDPELTVSAKDAFAELESAAMFLDDGQQRSLNRISRLMNQDFSKVFRSVETSILPLLPGRTRPRNGEARLKLYKKHVLEPYKSEISSVDGAVGVTLRRAYDQVLARMKTLAATDTI